MKATKWPNRFPSKLDAFRALGKTNRLCNFRYPRCNSNGWMVTYRAVTYRAVTYQAALIEPKLKGSRTGIAFAHR